MTVDEVAGQQLHLSVLTAGDVDAIHLASLEILERTGMFVELPEALELFRGAGARVDGNRVRIPSCVVDSALRSVPHRIVIADREGRRCLHLEDNRSYYRSSCDHARILDPYTGSLRPFKTSDYQMTARVVDACLGVHAGGCGHTREYPAEVRIQAGFKQCMLNMRKPFVAAPLNAQQMEDIYDMAAAIAGGHERLREAPFVIATAEPTTPLGVFKDTAEILLLAARQSMPIVWYGMPAAGSTAPSTPAGVLALGNAEILAGLVLHQSAKPGAPFIYGMMPSMMDMRSTQWAYGSPDFALMLAAATDLGHSYGIPVYGTAGCTDASALDLQAAAEATVLGLMGQLSGANLIHDIGLLAGNQFISPEMIVLCDELVEMTDHATRRIDTSQDELALDLIDQVGPQGNYLALDHTLANFRRFWHSGIFLRNRLPASPEDEPESVAERINQKTREIIETHKVDPLTDDVMRELDELESKWMSRVEGN